MTEPAMVSIWSLIYFFPRENDIGWRCRICPVPPGRTDIDIADSPRWNVGPDDAWAQHEARNHLAELHGIKFQYDHLPANEMRSLTRADGSK